jgi:hypothetical protein
LLSADGAMPHCSAMLITTATSPSRASIAEPALPLFKNTSAGFPVSSNPTVALSFALTMRSYVSLRRRFGSRRRKGYRPSGGRLDQSFLDRGRAELRARFVTGWQARQLPLTERRQRQSSATPS